MSKKLFSKIFVLLLVVGLLFAVAPTRQVEAQVTSTWDGNYPTEKPVDMLPAIDGVQRIYTAAEFAWLASQADMFPAGVTTVKLMVDIDLANHPWKPSGGLASGSAATGNIFDGNGHKISNLRVVEEEAAGLFVGNNGGEPIVQNLVIEGAYIEATPTATNIEANAAVVAVGIDGGFSFSNVTVRNATVKGTKYIAGISAYSSGLDADGGYYTNCTVENTSLEVQEMWNTAEAKVEKPHAGGVVGLMNKGKFSGNRVTDLTITVLPVDGQAVATERVGALIGTAQAPVLVGTYDVSGVTYNGGPYAKIIGLDNRTYKVVNATQMLGYTTIQAAIDAAANEDTIMVFAGTYAEDVVVTNKFFNLIGEVDTNGDPITILEGSLSINNPSYYDPKFPEFTEIKNIYFDRTVSHLLILQNFNGGLIENCVFDGNNGFIDYPFNGINLVSGGNGNSNITIQDSTFKDGLYVGIGGKATGLTVQTSEFTNVKSGINLQGGGDLVVQDSTFLTKPVSDGDSYGIRFASATGPTPNLTVTGSTFEIDNSLGFDPADGEYHVALYIRAGATGNLLAANNNILHDVVNLSSTPLDANNNWWGEATGPAEGQVSGKVYHCYWLDAPAPDGNVVAGSLVTNEDTGETFCAIQAAIDDEQTLDGHTITVDPGTYAEQVIVDKAVTLLGPNAGISAGVTPGTRVDEAVIKGPSDDWFALYAEVDGVTIDGFTIDGSLLDPGTSYVAGIYGTANDFLVQNNVFANFENGIAILTSGGYSGYLTGVDIKDNSMVNATVGTNDYNFGIYLQSSLGTVSGNAVGNYRAGIQIQPYSAPGAGEVINNTFSTYSTGMYFNYTQDATADWSFEGNEVVGIPYPSGMTIGDFKAITVQTFYEGNVDFEGNSILAGTSDADPIYLYYETNITNGMRDAKVNWWGSADGPIETQISGIVDYLPWCADAACETLAPVFDDVYETDEDTILDVAVADGVLKNEIGVEALSGTVAIEVATDVTNGTLTLDQDGSFTYEPDADFFGEDTFTYIVTVDEYEFIPATVTINVTPVKDQVNAVDDEYETDENITLTIAAPGVRANDVDVDLNNMTVGLVTDVEHGALTLNGDGSFVYVPDLDFYGEDSFMYQLVTYPATAINASDPWIDQALVTITVHPVDDAPIKLYLPLIVR